MPLLQQLRKRLTTPAELRPVVEGLPAEFLKPDQNITLITWNRFPSALPADSSERLFAAVRALARRNFLCSACAVLPAGVATTLVYACGPRRLGAHVAFYLPDWETAEQALFSTIPAALVTCISAAHCALSNTAERTGEFLTHPIGRTTTGCFHIDWMQCPVISTSLDSLIPLPRPAAPPPHEHHA